MGTVQENVTDRSSAAAKKRIENKENEVKKTGLTVKPNNTSMSSLIVWNISKALEKKPCMDLKSGIRTAQERLQRVARDGNTAISQHPEEEHLVCALLAWQQLGHTRADSLYEFIMSKKIGDTKSKNSNNNKPLNTLIVTSNSFNIHCNGPKSIKEVDPLRYAPYSSGPIIKLPNETKIIMRMDNPSRKSKCTRCRSIQGSQDSKVSVGTTGSSRSTVTSNKIDSACCMESECGDKLAQMDALTEELKSRAQKLARREAQRSELLERAEAAWKDLERGYQRRLALALEKEEDINKQIQKTMEERNEFKKSCNALAQELKEKGDVAEADRSVLKGVEAEVCHYACHRLKLNEEMTRVEAALAEQQCKTVQLQRDLQFKEEQVRRKVMTMESETESARALTHETERALRAELSGLRDQINQVSKQLLEEDEVNKKLKIELEFLRKEKMGMIEDLDGCKLVCDGKIKAQMDELQARRKQLQELKDKELECRCKLPVDSAVEVKRTASLAALCKCAPEDRYLDSCSCTSMKGRLLSNLLADLFGGLQSELGGTGTEMPCQLLKCLEDSHNWDRSSVTKTNLRSYFSNLLVGELDIAIATSIENYHAKWVGTSCVDETTKMTPGPQDDLNEGWEKRAIERRAQKLAAQLAEELYEKRAEELTKRAKAIVTSGPPPCECKKSGSQCAYPCLLESVTPFSAKPPEVARKAAQVNKASTSPPPTYWKRTHRDVTQLRLEIEDLKKEAIKKEDLKLMEQNIAKIVKNTAASESYATVTKDNEENVMKNKKDTKLTRNVIIEESQKSTVTNKKKSLEGNNLRKMFLEDKPIKHPKKYNYNQTYSVNLCLCGSQRANNITQNNKSNKDSKQSVKNKSHINMSAVPTNHNQSKCAEVNKPTPDRINGNLLTESFCDTNCKCFQKVPSNTSIDKLLETLTKWKSDLSRSNTELANIVPIVSKTCLNKNSKSILKNKNVIDTVEHCLKDTKNEISDSKRGNRKNEFERQTHSINFHQAVKTMSEYMADVNLDKSNEYACKYADTTESRGNDKDVYRSSGTCSGPFNCIDSDLDPNHKLDPTKGIKERLESKEAQKILNEHLYNKTNNPTIINILNNAKSTRAINTEKNSKESELTNNLVQTSLIPNDAKILSSDLDYCVKFLGVTLADPISQNTNSFYKSKTVTKLEQPKSETVKCEDIKSVTSKREEVNSESSKSSKDSNKMTVLNMTNKLKRCECKAKFEEFKKCLIGVFNDQVKRKKHEFKDIAIDSQSLSCQIEALSSCICCDKKHGDCSTDLEVNAFDLLEAHLKEKIKEFKICSCESSCISAEEEEKIFRTILKRVKQVISDCANQLKCNEPGRLVVTSEGSWKRAYGLLQEYLKMKIKRAQCLPLSSDDKDVVLPDILEKVCDLIESDFQKLKDLCKCEKHNKLLTKITSPESKEPEKDGSVKKNIKSTLNTLTHQNSMKPKYDAKNMSSQVNSNAGMESKSCNARSKDEMIAKSCEAMIKSIKHVNVVSTQNSSNAFMHSISSQAPLQVGKATKSCNVSFQDNIKISKGNLTESIPTKSKHVLTQPLLAVDTKSCDAMVEADKIVKIVSTVNIPYAMGQVQHRSSQINSSLGMESKFCDATINDDLCLIESAGTLQMDTQSCGTAEIDSERNKVDTIEVNNSENLHEVIYNTCNCNYTPLEPSRKDLDTKTVLYNIQGDFLMKSHIKKKQETSECVNINVLKNIMSLPNLPNIECHKPVFTLHQQYIKNKMTDGNVDQKINNNFELLKNTPYIGSTVDCTCDNNFKSCTCIKSLIQGTNYKITNTFKEIMTQGQKSNIKYSYIMDSKRNRSNHEKLCDMLQNLSTSNDHMTDNYYSFSNAERILKSNSKEAVENNQSANNLESTTNLARGLDFKGPANWLLCPQPTKSQTRSTTVKLFNSSLYYEPVDESVTSCKSYPVTEPIPSTNQVPDSLYYVPVLEFDNSRKSATTSDTSNCNREPQNTCKCYKVPLCHVKMLVENIERNLIESKCTCDSVFKICPVHCRNYR